MPYLLFDLPELGSVVYKDKQIFGEGFEFGYKFIVYLLEKYGRSDLIYTIDSLKEQSSVFCDHIGEAILAVSYVNRLKFKLMFENDNACLFSIATFCQYVGNFYEKLYVEGYFDQFLLACGFLTDLTLYMCNRVGPVYAGIAPQLFGILYERVLSKKFLERGGWNELRLHSRPWWYAYRFSRQNMEFHCPERELFNSCYTSEMLSALPTEIETYEEHAILLPPEFVPEEDTSRYPPSCQSFCMLSPDKK